MKVLLLATTLFIVNSCFCQTPPDTLRIFFDTDKFDITEESRTLLDDRLGNAPVSLFNFALRGHCDSRGSEEYNIRLSKNRVQAVRRYLLSKGIAENSIREAKGFGESLPIANNDNDEGQAQNRRVELIFYSTLNDGTLTEILSDSTLTVGTNITLRNINFEGGRSIILESSFPALNELLAAMKAHPGLIIQIEGHICCQDGPQDGMDMGTGLPNLSEARARAIRNYLVENGIAPNRLSFEGFGHSRPLHPYPEETEEQRTANRRVELRIIRK
jgi:outer membrane protein OmpA-like peptidoglycan-associated protein